MPMNCLTTDIPALFRTSGFGDTATYKGVSVEGIFDDGDVEVQVNEGFKELVHQTTFTAATTDFTSIAEGDILTVNATDYTIKFWNDDGTGVIEIHLELP